MTYAGTRATRIDVLLSTFNGAAFLAEQLDSLLAQEDSDLTILARDDGSTDQTPSILRRYADRFAGRVVLFGDDPRNLGVVGSYGWLMGRSSAPYVAFSDQDDVWHRQKLRILMARMREAEARLGAECPILVHSDLEVVNERLENVHASFWAYSGVGGRRLHLRQLLISNAVTACALLANRALLERAAPIPPEALMHDHWLALVAAAFGRIETVEQPLVAYRQHRRNALGAGASGWRALVRRVRSGSGRKDIRALQAQAGQFAERFAGDLDPSQRELVQGFSVLHRRNWIAKRLFLVRHGILRAGVVRNLVLLFHVRMAEDTA